MSFRPANYPCTDIQPHEPHDHTDGPDQYYYHCDGMEWEDDPDYDDDLADCETPDAVWSEGGIKD